MRYCWKHYSDDDAKLVDSWLDDYAIKETGLDDGWQDFYDYWMAESSIAGGKDKCFIILDKNTPFAVIYIGIIGAEIIISEYIVAPDMRSKGYGSAALKELFENAVELLSIQPTAAKAVIFPKNIASVKAFEKAGFALEYVHPDGDVLNYEYVF